MALPKEEPMLTVKQAAQILGVDPRTIREKLSSKQIRGEKRLHGLKEKWFVVAADIEAIARTQVSRSSELHQQRIDTSGTEPLFEKNDDDDDEEDAIEVNAIETSTDEATTEQADLGKQQLELVINAITQQFTQELTTRLEIMQSLQNEIAEKDKQLKLIPDLEKAAKEREKAKEELQNKVHENDALKRQLEILEIERKNKLQEYEQSKSAIEELSSQEQNLKEQIASISQEKETQEKNAKEKEEELNRLKLELESREKEIEKLQAPWWKKWFLPREIEEN